MDDSMEDFIRICRNVKSEEPKKINNEIQITMQRKKECDARAFKIVEFSIEGKLQPEVFTKCLPYINQSHYQDIVEERAISKLCGYSICGKRIPDMPKKQFYISTKNNKVFDITERKNFCSNYCYKASLHIKKQIDDSPLWLRKLDDIPEYQLLEKESGIPGECVNQGIARPVVEESFTSVSAFTEVSLNDMVENEIGNVKPSKGKNRGPPKKMSKLVKTMQTIRELVDDAEETESSKENIEVDKPVTPDQKVPCSRTLPIIVEKDENADNKSEETVTNTESPQKLNSRKPKKKNHSKSSVKVDAEALIKSVIKDWLSLETYIFLYGETKIRQILNEKKLSDYFDELHIAELNRNQQAKYMDICKRLHLQEMADDKFDQAIIGNSDLKPPPDFKKLKEDSKMLSIKVKCFYSGMLQEKEDPNFPTKINKETNENATEDVAVLPLVDVNSQKAMRRKIFLNAINKSMQQLLQALRVRFFAPILSDLQHLVKTFRLRADNIVFKPALWNHIAVVLLFILAIKDPNIKNILDEASSKEFIKLQLSTLPSKDNFISDIIMDVQNVDMFVEQFISSN